MTKHLSRILAIALLAASFPVAAFAATAPSSNATKAAFVAASIDAKASLAQVSGLTVESVAYSYAPTGDIAVIAASKKPICYSSFACPQYLQEYQIYVSAKTSVLDRNRKALDLATIAPGDTINAYGSLAGSLQMRAQIVRDLDKPVRPKEVQLENLQVYSVGKDGFGGYELVAGSDAGSCYEWAGGYKSLWSCPRPLTSDAAVQSMTALYRPSVIYRISVPKGTTVIDATRRPIVRVIQVGDTINVYGTMDIEKNVVTAKVVRVTSMAGTASSIGIKAQSDVTLQLNASGQVALAVGGYGTQAPYTWTEDKVPAPGRDKNLPAAYLTGMPPGMTLTKADPSQCPVGSECLWMPGSDAIYAWIAGTPTRAGTYVVNVRVTDAHGATATTYVVINVRKLIR